MLLVRYLAAKYYFNKPVQSKPTQAGTSFVWNRGVDQIKLYLFWDIYVTPFHSS